MKFTTLALALFAGIGTGCATDPFAHPVATSDLPDCYAANYDAQRDLFTMKVTGRNLVNQQCVLNVGPSVNAAPAPRLAAGHYTVYLANGGGGGAGGTMQGPRGGGGAGGGGAGAREIQSRVYLAEGAYRLTIGAGGPGGSACVFGPPIQMAGGPGWLGSPSNIVRIATGDVVAGVPEAGNYVRPSRAEHDRSGGRRDGHGGSGPGQTSGGHGGSELSGSRPAVLAESGQSVSANGTTGAGGIPGGNEDRTSAGGGGGATSRADGGGGGGEAPGQPNRAPQRGSLGSGGGGGEGGTSECDEGARGGHGFIALRRI